MARFPKQASGLLLVLLGVTGAAHAVAVRAIPDLVSVTFYERTGGVEPSAWTFSVYGPELTTRLADPLSATNRDFFGVPTTEYYDVYYSDPDGTFNLDGEYLSIEGVYGGTSPGGGGLNLAEIALNFSGAPAEYGNFVASYLALGSNAFPQSVGNAIDGNLLTHTTMGNTVGTTQRLRVTLGFLSSSGPPPSVVPIPAAGLLLLSSLAGIGWLARRKQLAA